MCVCVCGDAGCRSDAGQGRVSRKGGASRVSGKGKDDANVGVGIDGLVTGMVLWVDELVQAVKVGMNVWQAVVGLGRGVRFEGW